MSELLLYGLDEAGEAVLAETLSVSLRPTLRKAAEQRLSRCHAVEIWDGPACVLRLRRPTPARFEPE